MLGTELRQAVSIAAVVPFLVAAAALADCSALERLELPDTHITSVEMVETGSFDPEGLAPAIDSLPSFCRVAGTTEPAIRFEVWLPLSDWSGRFQGVGNGGMAGTISYGAMAAALRRGSATASTDTGHVASGNAFDASWALGRPDLVEDFGHRSLHLTTVNGKKITEAFYGQAPHHSYYVGCSKGGQQGLMEAQRYPGDYDGLIAGDPANDWTRFYAGAHLWYSLATLADAESWISPAKVELLGKAVNDACDAEDGIEDGILNDPRRCAFEPTELTCALDQDRETCLAPKQVEAVTKIWAGSHTASGKQIYPGLVPGGEAGRGGWSTWVTGREPFTSLHWYAAEGFFKYLVFEDPDWDFRSFDYDGGLAKALAKTGPAIDAADPDLRPLRDRGGKLIVYHGWSDADISPLASIDYFESVVSELGAGKGTEQAREEVQSFFRLFMVPGMGHCRGGPGPDRFDALTALERWVEEGVAPERIIASKVVDGTIVRERPLCAYPEEARWTGGSIDEEKSFVCVVP